jgi:small subunit ribosomal protein S20
LTHSRSAEKRVRQAERRRIRNRSIRGATRTTVRKALPPMAEGRIDEAADAVRQAASALDSAAQKGVIHVNSAARRKARLMKKYNSAVAAASAVKEEAAPAKAARRPSKRVAAKKPATKAPPSKAKPRARKAPAKK